MAAFQKKDDLPPTTNTLTLPRLNIFTIEAVNGLAYARIASGVGCLLAPSFTARLFGVALASNSFESVLVRLFGIGPAVLGDLTWYNRPKFGNTVQTESERRELRHVLWANVAADVLEGGIVMYAASKGLIPRTASLCMGGASALFLATGLFALREV
jgi:hypothetical protein